MLLGFQGLFRQSRWHDPCKIKVAIIRREILILAAVKLFEIGWLSSGRASELAGMSRIEFLLNLNGYKVFPFASELDDLENAHV